MDGVWCWFSVIRAGRLSQKAYKIRMHGGIDTVTVDG